MKKGYSLMVSMLMLTTNIPPQGLLQAQTFASARFVAEAAGNGETDKQGSQLLENALVQLEKRYGIFFLYDNEKVKDKRVTLELQGNEKIEKVLTRMLKPIEFTFKKVGNVYTIVPAGDAPAMRELKHTTGGLYDNGNTAPQLHTSLSLPAGLEQRVASATADIPVSGRVTDEKGGGIPGVSVLVKGTTNGTTTDVDGRFKLTAPDNGTLVFSFIGYTTQEAAIGNRSVFNVTLLPDVEALSEVVVVGYGTQKKETATGSITSIKGKEVVQAPVTNVTNGLAGRLPGVIAVTRSGEPGGDGSTIRIRGANSLGNNDALIVVDGIPGRSLERIDGNSIESVTVLKDASAAIYGSQAANGVILITTKRGKVGKPEIQLNLNQGYGRPTRVPEMASSAEYATMLNEIDIYRGRDPRYSAEEVELFRNGSDPWRYPNTDWFDAVLKPWSGQANGSLSISGGSENLRAFILVGARNQDGYYRNSATRYTQYDFRGNLDGRISKHVNFSLDIGGRQENRFYPTRGSGSIFWMTMRGKPQMQAYWPNGMPGPDIEYGDNPAVISTDATGYDRDKRYILNTTARLNIEIPWVKGLSLTSNVGIDKGFGFHKRMETPWYLYSWDGTSYGADGEPVLVKSKKGFTAPNLRQGMTDNSNILLNALVNYDRTFGVHGLKFMIGTERRHEKGDNFMAYRRNLMSESIDQLFTGAVDDFQQIDGRAYQRARLNYFGRVNYTFSEKYLAEFVWRYDGTYQFRGNQYGFFPGISLGWRISEESFWKNSITFIDNFKVRGSWGRTGNDRMEVNGQLQEWNFMSIYDLNFPVVFGITEQNRTLAEVRVGYPQATWEVANQSNIGFETDLFNNHVFLEMDYFNNIRSGILWTRNASVPQTAGFIPPYENIGKVANRGFEFNLGYNNEAGGLKYSVGVNGGYAKNKILFWDEAPGAPEWQRSTGHPMNTGLYYNAIGIFRDQAHVDATPAKWADARPGDVIFEDIGGPEGKVPDGKIDSYDRIRIDKTDLPRFMGGLSAKLEWKGFDLDVLFQTATGAVRYVSTESGEIGNFTRDFYKNRWTPENPNASQPRTFNRGDEYWRNQGNTQFLQNADYVRLKNLVLGYTLPAVLTQRVGMQSVRFYVSGFNLLTFSPGVKDFDPESNNSQGTNYPLQKVVNGGLSVTF